MNFSAKKLALSAMLLCLLTLGAVLPASAAVRFPWDKPAVNIEPGEYAASMEVGEAQQLSPVLTPADSNSKIKYASDNEALLTVTGSGEVQALGVGVVNVTATAGDVSCVYTIDVRPNASMIVAEMDLTLSSNRIGVGDSTTLSIQVLPTSAAEYAQLTLSSSNESVATVNNFGKVTGIAPGTATITATCGEVSASAKITVVSTETSTPSNVKLTLNTTYVVLKPGATKTLQVSVSPSGASKKFTFKSNDTKVATVSSSGVITAVGTGATSILVSNGTASASVTVIVNRTASSGSDSDSESTQDPDSPQTTADPVVQAIQESAEEIVSFAQSEVPVVTSEMLNALRVSGKTLRLTAAAEGYTLSLKGADVRNTTNAFHTQVTFTPAENGLELSLQQDAALPGNVQIELHTDAANYQRLYLYNEATGKWQYLNSYENGVVTVDSTGRYLLTNNTITLIHVNWFFLGAAGVVVVLIGIVYIVFKKRYWFW